MVRGGDVTKLGFVAFEVVCESGDDELHLAWRDDDSTYKVGYWWEGGKKIHNELFFGMHHLHSIGILPFQGFIRGFNLCGTSLNELIYLILFWHKVMFILL